METEFPGSPSVSPDQYETSSDDGVTFGNVDILDGGDGTPHQRKYADPLTNFPVQPSTHSESDSGSPSTSDDEGYQTPTDDKYGPAHEEEEQENDGDSSDDEEETLSSRHEGLQLRNVPRLEYT